ncbi:hypothetical protein [Bacillus dakarensis]|uniref:hypothetical protein n=1 Tax=Robertmurraya dakarensis TaxID=1926278 RepID=UPI00098200E2|nr:hypothetical protein [Bacillus dakarensis]
MSVLALTEVTKFFRSYGIKCDKELVEEWINTTSNKENLSDCVCEDDLYNFNEWCRWKGTAYEEGLDDQTKIARLLEEVKDLQIEVSALKKEKEELELKLGIESF